MPIDLALAVVYTESTFNHYNKDNLVINQNGDYGLMQINKTVHPQAFNDKATYGDIVNNWQDNVNYGLFFLFECYNEAKDLGYTGNDLLKATYSNYNSGSCSAYYNTKHNAHKDTKEHVGNFWRAYSNKSRKN